jgi:tetratricopeptide (TPR) repeat protein
LRRQAKWEELERRVRAQLERDPMNTVMLGDLFNVHEVKRRYRDGLQDARQLMQKFPDDPSWTRRYVRYAVLSGDPDAVDKAVSASEEGTTNPDDERRLLGTLADAYDDLGDHNRAIDYFEMEAAVEPDREFSFIYRALGYEEMVRGRWDASRKWFEKALEVNPKGSEGLEAIGGLLRVNREARDTEGMRDAAYRLVRELPPSPMKMLLPAFVQVAEGRMDEAEKVIDDFMARPDPEWSRWDAMLDIGWHYYLMGHTTRAEDIFKRAIALEIARRDPRAHIGLGICQLAEQRYKEAGRSFEQALTTGYSVHERGPRLGLAAVNLIQGNSEDAESLVRAELDVVPHVDSWRALALVHTAQGRLDDALPVAERCVALDSTRASHELLAWVLVAGDIDVDRGMREAERALELPIPASDVGSKLPIWPSADHSLGLAYLKNEQPKQAAEHLRRAAELQPDRASLRSDLKRAEALLDGTP